MSSWFFHGSQALNSLRADFNKLHFLVCDEAYSVLKPRWGSDNSSGAVRLAVRLSKIKLWATGSKALSRVPVAREETRWACRKRGMAPIVSQFRAFRRLMGLEKQGPFYQ